jgi:hypothetical protein
MSIRNLTKKFIDELTEQPDPGDQVDLPLSIYSSTLSNHSLVWQTELDSLDITDSYMGIIDVVMPVPPNNWPRFARRSTKVFTLTNITPWIIGDTFMNATLTGAETTLFSVQLDITGGGDIEVSISNPTAQASRLDLPFAVHYFIITKTP